MNFLFDFVKSAGLMIINPMNWLKVGAVSLFGPVITSGLRNVEGSFNNPIGWLAGRVADCLEGAIGLEKKVAGGLYEGLKDKLLPPEFVGAISSGNLVGGIESLLGGWRRLGSGAPTPELTTFLKGMPAMVLGSQDQPSSGSQQSPTNNSAPAPAGKPPPGGGNYAPGTLPSV